MERKETRKNARPASSGGSTSNATTPVNAAIPITALIALITKLLVSKSKPAKLSRTTST